MLNELVAARTLNMLYVWLDLGFLALLAGALIYARRYMAVLVGLIGGVIYFIVDYGFFYHLLGTREVLGAPVALFLLWLSLSYGFTNFAWIWLWLDKDGHRAEWSVFILSGWLFSGFMSQSLGGGFPTVMISRGTSRYHGLMGLMLFVGYALLCVWNVRARGSRPKAPILSILAIGILVQGSWEAVLLLTGIRPAGLQPLIVNALLETNMGLPYIYMIHRAVTRRFGEDLRKR